MLNHTSLARLRSLAIVLTLAAFGSGCGSNNDACAGVSVACISLHVVSNASSSVDQLTITLSGSYVTGPAAVSSQPTQLRTLPFDLAIPAPTAKGGTETLLLTAVDNDQHSLEGQVSFELDPRQHAETGVDLVPFTMPASDVDMAK